MKFRCCILFFPSFSRFFFFFTRMCSPAERTRLKLEAFQVSKERLATIAFCPQRCLIYFNNETRDDSGQKEGERGDGKRERERERERERPSIARRLGRNAADAGVYCRRSGSAATRCVRLPLFFVRSLVRSGGVTAGEIKERGSEAENIEPLSK